MCVALATSLRHDTPLPKLFRRYALCLPEPHAAGFTKAVVCCNACFAYRYVVDLDKDIDVNKVKLAANIAIGSRWLLPACTVASWAALACIPAQASYWLSWGFDPVSLRYVQLCPHTSTSA